MDVRDSVAVDPSLPSKEAMLQRARLIGKMWHELPAEDKEVRANCLDAFPFND